MIQRQQNLYERYKDLPGKILPDPGGAFLLARNQVTDNHSTAPLPAELNKQHNEPTSRQRWLKITTSDPDRSGDVMSIAGAETDNFERNPQFLWLHGMTDEPVHTIGKIARLVRTTDAIYALAEYASADESPLAEQIYAMDVAGLLGANSIGFRPLEWEPNEFGGLTFTKWELLEVSKVEIPCNPYAVDDGAPSIISAQRSLTIDQAASLLVAA